ncbi:MAG: thioredoxin family protein, partial [Chloroflexi bacterium]|nr:thioredoxin family protein [Chloroflexota bacterium]
LCLGEDWCPDVWRGIPVIAKVSEQTGMELRIFFRDKNKDIMSEFLNQGEFESIPTIVFYDRDHNYLGHWIERPVLANDEMEGLRDILSGVERGTPQFDEARARYNEETWKLAPNWRHASVSEFRTMLEEALG